MQEENIGNTIRRLRKERGLTQGQLAAFAGVGRSWLSVVESSKRGRPEPDRLRKVARILRIPADNLLAIAGYNVTPMPIREDRSEREILQELDAKIKAKEDIVLVPVSSYSVSAGAGSAAETEYVAYRRRPSERNHEFVAVEVKGCCLEPEVFEGELVIADKNVSPKEGDIVVAEYENDRIVKILSKEKDSFLLHALDGRPDILVSQSTTILGVVVSINRRPRRRR